MPTQLTPHFSLEELTYSETAARLHIDNTPTAAVMTQLQITAELLERVRTLLGHKPISVTSGYRSPQLNSHPEIGGAYDSDHTHGRAADFVCPDFGTPHQICIFLEKHIKDLGVHQLIHEFQKWVHIAHREHPNHMAMTIDHQGTRHGFA